jgi:hypothetical protein
MVHEKVSTGGSVEIVTSGLHWEKSEASCGYLQNKSHLKMKSQEECDKCTKWLT